MPVLMSIFAALLLLAGITDLITYRIPNWLIVSLVLVFFLGGAFFYHEISWAEHIEASVLCLGVGLLIYFLGHMGAGDIKFIAAVALWGGMSGLIEIIFAIAVLGLTELIAILLLRFAVRNVPLFQEKIDPLPKVLRPGAGIPYGVAIAMGSLIATPWYENLHW